LRILRKPASFMNFQVEGRKGLHLSPKNHILRIIIRITPMKIEIVPTNLYSSFFLERWINFLFRYYKYIHSNSAIY